MGKDMLSEEEKMEGLRVNARGHLFETLQLIADEELKIPDLEAAKSGIKVELDFSVEASKAASFKSTMSLLRKVYPDRKIYLRDVTVTRLWSMDRLDVYQKPYETSITLSYNLLDTGQNIDDTPEEDLEEERSFEIDIDSPSMWYEATRVVIEPMEGEFPGGERIKSYRGVTPPDVIFEIANALLIQKQPPATPQPSRIVVPI